MKVDSSEEFDYFLFKKRFIVIYRTATHYERLTFKKKKKQIKTDFNSVIIVSMC